MNQREVSELRRRWRPEKSAAGRIYGCFVNSGRQIVSDLEESLGLMTQEEAETYLELLKKTLSGTLGKNLIDIVFSTRQVADSEEHRLLSDLRSSGLKDRQIRNAFYQKVIDSLDMNGENYLILMACDAYDVPHRSKDDELQPDASDEVFTYFLCCVCPVKAGRAALGYFPGDNEFHYTAGQVVSPPELGFLFPAFDNRSANIYNALFYSRKPDELHQEFIDAVFHTEPPMSSGEQREAFQEALSQALEEVCSVDVARTVHERLAERIVRHKETRDPEPLAVTAGDIGTILQDCGVSEARVDAFRENCDEKFGENTALSPANLIDAGKFQLRTSLATVSVDPGCSYLVETRVIDGRKYILIPAEEDMEINGLPVRFAAEQEQ